LGITADRKKKKNLQHYLAANTSIVLIFSCPKVMVMLSKPQQEGSLLQYFSYSDTEAPKV